MVDQREFCLLGGRNPVQIFQICATACDHGTGVVDPIVQNILGNLIEISRVSGKAKWNTRDAVHEIGNQSGIMRKMSMQMV